MIETLESVLATALLRQLERSPSLNRDKVLNNILEEARDSGFLSLSEDEITTHLHAISNKFRRYGVLNPKWLAQKDQYPHFFLVNAEPGWFEHMLQSSEDDRPQEGISQYIVYGDWDSLVILYGTHQEAETLYASIDSTMYERTVFFSASSVPLIYGHKADDPGDVPTDLDTTQLNEVIRNYDSNDLTNPRNTWFEQRLLLGPTWIARDGRPYGVVAFVGITLNGRARLRSPQVLQALLDHPDITRTLVHLFAIDRGMPFHYFAKLACSSMAELDRATNAISSLRIESVRVDGNTLVVANGLDRIPVFRTYALANVLSAPSTEDLETLSQELITILGPESVDHFNNLSTSFKILALRIYDELENKVRSASLAPEWKVRLQDAARALERQIVDRGSQSLPRGSVVDCAATVEAYLKNSLELIIRSAFGGNFKEAQTKLHLPTRKVKQLTMGKILVALRKAREVEELQFLRSALRDEWLDRLDALVGERNRWAHDDLQSWPATRQIDEARRFISEAIDILGWLNTDLSQALPESADGVSLGSSDHRLRLRPRSEDRRFGIFISHSSKDRAVAERIAAGLRAMNYPVWYDGWAIKPGDEIVDRIEQGLAKNDTLVVLLTKNSINSKWVRKELDTAIMAQLSGQDIKLIPVKLHNIEVPEALKTIRYIDLQEDFEEGMIDLIRALRKRRSLLPQK